MPLPETPIPSCQRLLLSERAHSPHLSLHCLVRSHRDSFIHSLDGPLSSPPPPLLLPLIHSLPILLPHPPSCRRRSSTATSMRTRSSSTGTTTLHTPPLPSLPLPVLPCLLPHPSSPPFPPVCSVRHVILPRETAKALPQPLRLLSENEWRSIGVQQSRGWVHYEIHRPEPHVLLFRRPLGTDPITGKVLGKQEGVRGTAMKVVAAK